MGVSIGSLALVQEAKDAFLEQLQNSDTLVGKILAFIAQEMGREINTLGAKAQDPELQQLVVQM